MSYSKTEDYKKYRKSKKGKATQQRYRRSKKGRAAQKRYQQSRKGKASQKNRSLKLTTSRRKFLDEIKNKPCADCGHKFPPCCMDFHHIRGKKKFPIYRALSYKKWKLLAEIKKCILLCANCHRIRTHLKGER